MPDLRQPMNGNRTPRCAALRAILQQCLLIVLLAGAAVAFGPRTARAADPQIVARVNGAPVTLDELQRLLNDPLEQERLRRESGTPAPDRQALVSLALQELIHRQLLLQEAARQEFSVTEDEVDQALQTLRSRFDSLEEFGQWMQARGLDDHSLFGTLRTQILTKRVWTLLVEDVRLSRDEAEQYYTDHKDELKSGETIRLRIIAVRDAETAEAIKVALQKGVPFSDLARRRSVGRLAAKGGDTGWIDPGTLTPQLRRIVRRMKPGDIAGPMNPSENDFLLVGLQKRRSLQAENLSEAMPEIRRRLLPAKRRQAVRTWLAEQMEQAKIEVLLSPEEYEGEGVKDQSATIETVGIVRKG